MDIRKVKKLIELLEASDIAEIEIKEGEESVRISRGSSSVQQQALTYQLPQQVAPAPIAAPAAVAPSATPAASANAVKSPMVGTSIASHHLPRLPSSKWASMSKRAMLSASLKR